MARRERLRPAGFDELGLRRALADRMLPFMVAAMAFLASLALAGWVAAASLVQGWQAGAAASLTIQVPHPTEAAEVGGMRLDSVLARLRRMPGIASARALSSTELTKLLEPWLGAAADSSALPLPGVIAVRLTAPDLPLAPVAAQVQEVAPGSIVENEAVWAGRLTTLGRSLQACAAAALLVVAVVAAAVIAVATRGGLMARREAIEIVHGLGATDGYIAARFAARATLLAAWGGVIGGVLAAPVLLGLAHLAAPFETATVRPEVGIFGALPPALWLLLPGLPLAAATIGFCTAQGTVRRWLRRLP
jgi:cell division transport system permease protein